MKLSIRFTLALASVVAGLLVPGAQVASAQDVYKVNYFSNNIGSAPDATVRIDNPGLTYGNLCAMIYVFAADQQMAECCGCVQSHNNLNTYSVYNNLASPNLTLTAAAVPSGVIKIVSAPYPGYCDPANSYTPVPNLRAWVTHVQYHGGSSYSITETEFSDSKLGPTELASLQAQCGFIGILGSGFGICSCGDYAD
jgi:hypothetical protein